MTQNLRVGNRLGKYRLERKLGEGGSAVVWQARDTVEGRRVAIKVVLDSVIQEWGRAAVEGGRASPPSSTIRASPASATRTGSTTIS